MFFQTRVEGKVGQIPGCPALALPSRVRFGSWGRVYGGGDGMAGAFQASPKRPQTPGDSVFV